jgi:2-polyprenyl-3-methyl-5-hydroxy-6-metoxy-1,4-benzoquinol methylase
MESKYFGNQRQEVSAFLPYLEDGARIIDIGCGEGAFKANLKTSTEYWGVEPDTGAASIAAKNLDKVIIGTYLEAEECIPDNYFDVVICADVIEHMNDPDVFLRSIRTKLRPGGCIVGSIPNIRYISALYEILVKKDFRYKDDGIMDRTHLRFFTRKSFKNTIESSGFTFEEYAGINQFCYHSKTKKRFAIGLLGILLISVLGDDSKFMQYGFRIKPK